MDHRIRRSLIVLISLSLAVPSTSAHPRAGVDGKVHKHGVRQGGNGAFAGISALSGAADPTDALSIPGTTERIETKSPTSVSTIDPMTALSNSPSISLPPQPSTFLPPPINTTNSSLLNASSSIAAFVFPTTVLQIPVATICPDTASTFSLLAIPQPQPLYNITTSSTSINTTTAYLPPPVLANTSQTPSASLSPTTATTPPAHILLGSNGCQTLFTPTTTALCNTLISRGGQLPIHVTDCSQLVTFSSSPIALCTPTPTTLTSDVFNPTALPTTSTPGPMAYFLADWQAIAAGLVPTSVLVESCLQGAAQGVQAGATAPTGCLTRTESWSVATVTSVSTITNTVNFVGSALAHGTSAPASPMGVGVSPSPAAFYAVSLNTTQTVLSTVAHQTLMRQDVGGDPVTVTWTLDDVATTSGPAGVSHVTATTTVEGTVTSVRLVTVTGS